MSRRAGALVRGVSIGVLIAGCTHESASEQGMTTDTSDARAVELGAWTVLSAEGGSAAAIAGERTIAVGRGHAVVWVGEQRVASVDVGAASPGRPRVQAGRVAWGPSVLELDTGAIDLRRAAVPEPVPRDRGEVVQTYAWSADGAWLARSASGTSTRARVTLHSGETGELVASAWESSDLAPQALWLGPDWLAIGLRRPRVVDHAGHEIATIDLDGATLVRLEASHDGRWLIAVDLNRSIALIDTKSWAVVGRWTGPWVDASILPSGAAVVGLELGGVLRLACASPAGLREVQTLARVERAVSVQASDDAIAVVGGGELRRATLRVDCAA